MSACCDVLPPLRGRLPHVTARRPKEPLALSGEWAPAPHAVLPRQAELAATRPVVLIGGEHVKSEYREVVLQPTKTKTDNGRAVWSATCGVELHLYSDADGSWCLSNQYTPKESNHEVAFFMGRSLAPPAGERVWKLDMGMRIASESGKGWAEGKLMLLCGHAGAVREVRGLARHTRMSACCAMCFGRGATGGCHAHGGRQPRLVLSSHRAGP